MKEQQDKDTVTDKIVEDLQAGSKQMSQDEETRLWDKIGHSTHQYNRRKRIVRWTSAAAVVLLLLVGSAVYFLLRPVDVEIDYMSMIKTFDRDILNPDITLVLSKDKEITVEGKEAEVGYQDDDFVSIKTEEQEVEQKAAIEEELNQLIVPKGKRSFVTLADGTKMWVNAGTIVIYPVEFLGNKREIFVDGEVYLDVAPDKQKPFIVKSNDLHVEVLGTKFDVNAYKEDIFHHVTLVEGQVEVKLRNNAKQILRPNQQFGYNNDTWDIRVVNNMDHLAWIYGYYQYKDQPLSIVLRGLKKYYGDVITYDREVSNILCSGKLDIKTDIRDVLNVLQDATPIAIDYTGNKIHIHVKPIK